MTIERLIARVQETHGRLRKDMLQRVFDEFDGQLMQIGEAGRRQKYAKMAGSAFSFFSRQRLPVLFRYDPGVVPLSYARRSSDMDTRRPAF